MATTHRSTTSIEAERAHAWDIHDAAVRTHKAITQTVESRLTYIIQLNKGRNALAEEERVAERLVCSRFFDTKAPDRSTNRAEATETTLTAQHRGRTRVSRTRSKRSRRSATSATKTRHVHKRIKRPR
jgi:hypothetical protein